MTQHCKENLWEIRRMINTLNNDQYLYCSELLSHASIGQHVRHILEFYLCLLNCNDRIVNYDNRVRSKLLETDKEFAKRTIDEICNKLNLVKECFEMVLEGDLGPKENQILSIKTTISRELAYCLEHSIHHQALIKISLMEQELSQVIETNFGVAASTVRYRQQCVQ
jgi:hypothetical protein